MEKLLVKIASPYEIQVGKLEEKILCVTFNNSTQF